MMIVYWRHNIFLLKRRCIMQGNRAWAFCISFPDTLYLLNESLRDGSYASLEEQYDDILYYNWHVPNEAKKGDYIIYIVTPNNMKRIISFIRELNEYPEEWSSEDFEKLSAVLEKAKEDYAKHDGKLLCVADIKEITEENEYMYAQFSSMCSPPTDRIRCYDNTIVRANSDVHCLYLSYSQTMALIEPVWPRNEYTEILFNLNAGVPEPIVKEYTNQVQAFVVNNAFPNSLQEIIQDMECRGFLTIEMLLQEQNVQWTAPRWSKLGDIAFFMFTKTSSARISALTTEYNRFKENYTIRERRKIEESLHRGKELYQKYGGCIFAFARVEGRISYERQDYDSASHWRSPIYAPMHHLTVLEKPISIEVFREFLTISRQNTITPVLGEAFDKLHELIIHNNDVPDFFKNLKATPLPIKNITNDNWLTYGLAYRRHFFLEEAFRRYYVDYLLSELGDKKTIYRECKCYKSNGNPPRVDNIILLSGKYLPVEVKLSINNEVNIEKQVRQYCQLSKVVLGKDRILEPTFEKMYSTNVLIIDTEYVYLYDDKTRVIQRIYNLDHLTDMTKIHDLRKTVLALLAQCQSIC